MPVQYYDESTTSSPSPEFHSLLTDDLGSSYRDFELERPAPIAVGEAASEGQVLRSASRLLVVNGYTPANSRSFSNRRTIAQVSRSQ